MSRAESAGLGALMSAREKGVEMEHGRNGKWNSRELEKLVRGGPYQSGSQQKT